MAFRMSIQYAGFCCFVCRRELLKDEIVIWEFSALLPSPNPQLLPISDMPDFLGAAGNGKSGGTAYCTDGNALCFRRQTQAEKRHRRKQLETTAEEFGRFANA